MAMKHVSGAVLFAAMLSCTAVHSGDCSTDDAEG